MPDFTIKTYNSLLEALSKQGFSFQTFTNFVVAPNKRVIILRHDVDSLSANSLKFARIQSKHRIKGTYNFRIFPESFDEKIIKEIYLMGHEIGYHYEDLSFAWAKLKAQGFHLRSSSFGGQAGHHPSQGFGWQSRAQGEELERIIVGIGIELFSENLEKLRKIVPVNTICMHGSPMSRWDSRLLWKYYNYHDFGIIGEPYFDIDFDEVLYLTDTGRRWDGENVAIRDKAESGERRAKSENQFQDWKVKPVKYRKKSQHPAPGTQPARRSFLWPPKHSEGGSEGGDPAPFPSFHSTSDIIKAANEGKLPDKIMMTFHPQRWTDKPVPWVKELVWQNVKNIGKYFLVRSMK